MATFKVLKVDNSKESAVNGKWKNPGAALYDQLMNSCWCKGDIPTDDKKLEEAIESGDYIMWDGMLKEAYLIAPTNDIKDSPYGVTPFSRSGCKYPHHIIKGDKLVLSINGVKAAYSRAAQMGDIKGSVKEHLQRHLDELGIKYSEKAGKVYFDEEVDILSHIEDNFNSIYESIDKHIRISLPESVDIGPVTEDSIENLSQWIESVATNGFSESVDKHVGLYVSDFQCPHCGKSFEKVELLDNIPKNQYEDVMAQFPNWDGRYGRLGSVICPNCNKKEYAISTNNPIGESSGYCCMSEKAGHNYKHEFRYVVGENDGHLYQISYELNPANVRSDNADTGAGAERLRKNIKKTGHGNYTSAGNKILNITDMCTKKRVTQISAYPPIHNSGGNIMPMNIDKYMSIMEGLIDDKDKLDRIRRDLMKECPTGIVPNPGFAFAIKNSKKKGQMPIVYKVGDIDNTTTYKTTYRDNVLKGMLKLESVDSYSKLMNTISQIIDDDISAINAGKFNPSMLDKYRKDEYNFKAQRYNRLHEYSDQQIPMSFDSLTALAERNLIRDEIREFGDLMDSESIYESDEQSTSMPEQTDAVESDRNGVRRKKLYIAFIEWCKEYNNKNVFGSIFDKDAFKATYSFVPEEMRYFYRLANPILCVLGGKLTFFQASELRKLNEKNSKIHELLIFAATPNDMRVFNTADKKVYLATDDNGQLRLDRILGSTFDMYIQNLIGKRNILNGPIEESVYDDYSEEKSQRMEEVSE